MTPFPALYFQDFISAEGERLSTTSRHVAVVFGKCHDIVLHAIWGLTEHLPPKFSALNFRAVVFLDEKGESRVSYILSRDGFALLAMRFTGKKALPFQVAYIEAFNAMAVYITNQRDGLRYRCIEKPMRHKAAGSVSLRFHARVKGLSRPGCG